MIRRVIHSKSLICAAADNLFALKNLNVLNMPFFWPIKAIFSWHRSGNNFIRFIARSEMEYWNHLLEINSTIRIRPNYGKQRRQPITDNATNTHSHPHSLLLSSQKSLGEILLRQKVIFSDQYPRTFYWSSFLAWSYLLLWSRSNPMDQFPPREWSKSFE